MKTELLLSKEFLEKSIKSGNEYVWNFNEIMNVAMDANSKSFAILGGQVQYIFPEGTYELYWINADTSPKNDSEKWLNYVNRSLSEFVKLFNTILSLDIESEALNSEFMKIMKDKYLDIDKYKYFIFYPISEEEYNELKK